MTDLGELGSLMFSNGSTADNFGGTANSSMQIIYGYALGDSADGEVRVQIGDPIYSLDDSEDDDIEEVNLSEDAEDQADLIDEDEDPEDDAPEDEQEEIYWTDEDDDAVEDDDESEVDPE